MLPKLPLLKSWYSQKQFKLVFMSMLVLTLVVGTFAFATSSGSNQLLSANQQFFESWQTGWTPQGNTSLGHDSKSGIDNSGALVINVDQKGPWPDASQSARVGTPQFVEGFKAKPNATYSGSVFLRAKAGSSGTARCEIREYSDWGIIKTHTAGKMETIGDAWMPLSCSVTVSSQVKQLALRIFIADAQYGEVFYADHASFILGSDVVTPTTQAPTTAPTTTAPHTHPTDPPTTTQPPAGPIDSGNKSGSEFLETFTGSPSSPKSLVMNYPRWSMYPVSESWEGWVLNPRPMIAQHDHNCSAPKDYGYRGWDGSVPEGFHKITTFEDMVFQCKDHVMTASSPDQGGTAADMVVMKPNHLVDLTKGVATVSIDVSTLSPSIGSWWDIWISPWDTQLLHPSEQAGHFSGRPDNSLQSQIRDFDGLTKEKKWLFQAYDGNNRPLIKSNTHEDGFKISFDKGGSPNIRDIVEISTTKRHTYMMRIDKANSTVELLVQAESDGKMRSVKKHVVPGGIKFDYGVVQYLHSNYNPTTNAANPNCPTACRIPATWHWDNAVIKPSVPYTLINANERLIWDETPSKKITWDQGAPARSKMLFIANSDSYNNGRPELSFDGGKTWKRAEWVRPTNNIGIFIPRFDMLTYTIDVPMGQREALIRGKNYGTTQRQKWAAQNFQIVSK